MRVGTFYEVGHDFDSSTGDPNPIFDSRYSAGSLTRTGPFIKLHPGVAGLLLLLGK